MIKLSKRLEAIASFVYGPKVLDLGCDHAYLAIYLKQKGFEVSASDIKENICEVARNNIKTYHLDIPVFRSDGLKDIKEKFDTIIIAGMGGHLIRDILDKPDANQYVLSPHKNPEVVRKHMLERGYIIDKEEAIFDKKWYIIMSFVKGNKTYTEEDILYGPYAKNNKEYLKYLQRNTQVDIN